MRPIYGCPEIFRDYLTTGTTGYFSQNCMGFCSNGTVPISYNIYNICITYTMLYILFLYQHSFAQNFRLQFSVGVANPQFWEGEAIGGRGWYRSKEHW